MTQKLLANASGKTDPSPGDVLLADINTLVLIDRLYDEEWFEANGLTVANPERVVICFDHLFRAEERAAMAIAHPRIRRFASRHGIPDENVYDMGRHGLSHHLPAEKGWVVPGVCYVGHDTQAATMGAFNCYALPSLSSTVPALAAGQIWAPVPEAIRIELRGQLPRGVLGKDIYLRLLDDLQNVAPGRVLEVTGPGLQSLPIDVRMAIANGSNHIGAYTTIFEADDQLHRYLRPRARFTYEPVEADNDAEYTDTYAYDLEDFEPMVSGPGDITRITPLTERLGTKVNAAYIGSCSSGRLTDLTLAADVLQGRTIDPSVRLVVTPITSDVLAEAAQTGVLATLASAGATITTPGCGACFSGNESPLLLEPGDVCITGSVENWPGRMGSDEADIFVGNAAVVAASALKGSIADPRTP